MGDAPVGSSHLKGLTKKGDALGLAKLAEDLEQLSRPSSQTTRLKARPLCNRCNLIMSTFPQHIPFRSGTLHPKDTLCKRIAYPYAPYLTCIHASRESIRFGQTEHDMRPVRQMVQCSDVNCLDRQQPA
eukprot:1158756-Pelagomonas_calceolata.AAC.24